MAMCYSPTTWNVGVFSLAWQKRSSLGNLCWTSGSVRWAMVSPMRTLNPPSRAGSTSAVETTCFPSRAPKRVRRTSGIVKHILTLAFGKRWEKQLGAFLRVFDKYRRAKYLR